MSTSSPLQPVDPATFHQNEEEKEKPWIVRKIVQSLTGRIVVAVAHTLYATGTTVVCLSPWGDSVPLILPCIRFRDVVIHSVVAATGGAAIVATPLMGTAGGVVVESFGSSIVVELGVLAAHEATGTVANHLLINKPTDLLIPKHSGKLETTDIKKLLITLTFKHIVTDASLGFFRAPDSNASDNSLFSGIMDYFSIEKGWFSPYLFASCRRPLIPRTMVPDVVFMHGPWLRGDYAIGSTLLKHSENVVALAPEPAPVEETNDPSLFQKAISALNFGKATPSEPGLTPEAAQKLEAEARPPSPKGPPPAAAAQGPTTMIDRVQDQINQWIKTKPDSQAKEDSVAPNVPPMPPNRRMVVLVLAISPHRAGVWTSSQRPGESVINYTLLNGCPALVVPIKLGCPLIAWHAVTLKTLQGLKGGVDGPAFQSTLRALNTYMEFCVDEERLELPPLYAEQGISKQKAVSIGLELVLAGAVRSGTNAKVKKEIDSERAGIVFFRIP
ncbi:hypothetical protein PIIN_04969 [Serendipita indica DSM 11827]|uniref:Uncharacterized protein n=1 Tax=Serendipita indica (strain DSM 11827) TaxID=1109443 RepID=G4TI93_SERID|nr:hypothetical protein PIIN_04969 [Serendipita indica DSM 11827]